MAYENGDLVVAARLYASVARSRPKTEMTEKAKDCLEILAQEARQKITEIDSKLNEHGRAISPSDWGMQESWPEGWQETVTRAFQEYDQVVDDYRAVPAVKKELSLHVSQQRRRPEYAMALNEPEAKTLWDLAVQHEEEDHACCAYWVYEQASKLVPAPSAKRAAKRLAEMQKDPEILAAAKRCRELQWCHRTYRLAENLERSDPERAKNLFAQIVDRSPKDSEVHIAAQKQIGDIRPSN